MLHQIKPSYGIGFLIKLTVCLKLKLPRINNEINYVRIRGI